VKNTDYTEREREKLTEKKQRKHWKKGLQVRDWRCNAAFGVREVVALLPTV
jgi:hypothetical protein